MTFVKFTGATPYRETSYEDYLVFFEDEDNEFNIVRESVNFAIENAQRYSHLIDFSIDDDKNFIYLDYIQKCIDNASWTRITEDEFNLAIGILAP